MDRLKYAEPKLFCISIDVNKTYEADEHDKIYEVLSTLKSRKKIKNKLYPNRKI